MANVTVAEGTKFLRVIKRKKKTCPQDVNDAAINTFK